MLSLFRIARFAGSHHAKTSSGHSHSSHSASIGDSHDSESHDLHDSHGHAGHSHKIIPEGSWHRHSDDEDVDYWYNKYGPFLIYNLLHNSPPSHPDEVPEDDPYRNEIQGYIRLVDPDDNRRNFLRGMFESFVAVSCLIIFITMSKMRNHMDDDCFEKKVGDALITAQEIEIFISEAKERLH